MDVNFKEIIFSIITSIDLINPILKDHHRRVAIISYLLSKELGLSEKKTTSLIVAASLHDIGALTVEDSINLKIMDVENPEPHSILGAKMIAPYEAFFEVAKIIRYHHTSYSHYLENQDAPFESLILHLADRIEICLDQNDLALNQADTIRNTIKDLSGTFFAPALVDVFMKISQTDVFWFDIDTMSMEEVLGTANITRLIQHQSFEELEGLIQTFGRIIDYKSSFTATHSVGVAHIAYELAKLLDYTPEKCREIKIAGYLHDLGKIAVQSELLNKPAKLTKDEFNEIKSHVYYTERILKNIKGFENITKWAASHHEKLDGSGYPMKLKNEAIDEEIAILAYADVFTSLCEKRPYREAMNLETAMEILTCEFKNKLGELVYTVLMDNIEALNFIRDHVQSEAYKKYNKSFGFTENSVNPSLQS